jgi:hypothetical protein
VPKVTNDPQHWHTKAREARNVAEQLTSERAREHMLNCAEAYERLAKLAEQEPLFPTKST